MTISTKNKNKNQQQNNTNNKKNNQYKHEGNTIHKGRTHNNKEYTHKLCLKKNKKTKIELR